MPECHVETPCEACQEKRRLREQAMYENMIHWYKQESERIMNDMRFKADLDRRIAEARAAMPWWKRKLRRLP